MNRDILFLTFILKDSTVYVIGKIYHVIILYGNFIVNDMQVKKTLEKEKEHYSLNNVTDNNVSKKNKANECRV